MKNLLSLSLLLLPLICVAQERKVLRAATEAQFVGYWRILLIPDEKLKLKIKNKDTGYSDPCQFFVHKPDGSWTNVSIFSGAGEEETRRRCPVTRKQDVDLAIFAGSSGRNPYRWRKLPGASPAVFVIEDVQTRDRRIWFSDYVEEDLSLPGYFDLKKGDLIMNLAVPVDGKGHYAAAWRMVLRPVLQ